MTEMVGRMVRKQNWVTKAGSIVFGLGALVRGIVAIIKPEDAYQVEPILQPIEGIADVFLGGGISAMGVGMARKAERVAKTLEQNGGSR